MMALLWVALLLAAPGSAVCLVAEPAASSPLAVRVRAELTEVVGPVTVVEQASASCLHVVTLDETSRRVRVVVSQGAAPLVFEEPFGETSSVSMVSAHVAEMLRAALLEVETRRAAEEALIAVKPVAPVAAPVVTAPPSESSAGVQLALSPGALVSVGGLSPIGIAMLEVSARAWRWLSWGVTALVPLGALSRSVPEGLVWLRPFGAWASLQASFALSVSLVLRVGLGAGIRWSHVEGRAVAPFLGEVSDTLAALFDAEARLDWRLSERWGAFASVHAQTDSPRLSIETAGTSRARFGGLVGVFALGARVSW